MSVLTRLDRAAIVMNTQPKSAQTGQNHTPEFTPNFQHRLNALSQGREEFTLDDLTDSILLMCERAAAIVDVVALQFDGDAGKMSDAINSAALQAAVNEMRDIKAIIGAYYQSECYAKISDCCAEIRA